MYVGSEVVGRRAHVESRTVLVVDDEPVIRYLLAVTLEFAGYEVIEAPHGEAALKAARRAPPQLVITDRMPVMDGTELIKHLRADDEMAQIPIILLTATSGGEPHADAVLMKPFEPDKLIELVDTLTGSISH